MKNIFNLGEHFQVTDVKERCGLIIDGQVVETENIHPEPTTGFEIDPIDIIENLDHIEGTWHTHLNSTSTLSGDDYQCFIQWPDLRHYILSDQGVTQYEVREGAVINVNQFTW